MADPRKRPTPPSWTPPPRQKPIKNGTKYPFGEGKSTPDKKAKARASGAISSALGAGAAGGITNDG